MESLTYPDLHHVRAAEGWLDLGVTADASRELRQITAEAWSHPDVLELRWRLYAAERQWDAALDIARAATQRAPNRSAGWIHQSFCLHELQRTGEAWDLLQSVVDRFPEDVTIAYNLACYACRLGQVNDARTWLLRAVKLRGRAEIKMLALQDSDLAPLRDYVETL